MDAQQKFHLATKIVATIAQFGIALHYATAEPSTMDGINGVVSALVFCAIWLCGRSK